MNRPKRSYHVCGFYDMPVAMLHGIPRRAEVLKSWLRFNVLLLRKLHLASKSELNKPQVNPFFQTKAKASSKQKQILRRSERTRPSPCKWEGI
jgi:hypothetical protein